MEDMQYTIDCPEALRLPKPDGQSLPFETHLRSFRPLLGGQIGWHWHEEIELSRVRKGRILCRAGSEEILLEEGQYLFVNSNALHTFCALPGYEDSEKETFLFRPGLISLPEPEGELYARYVAPIAECRALPLFRFDGPEPWQAEACALFDQLFLAEQDTRFGRELLNRAALIKMWLLFAEHKRGACENARLAESRLVNEDRLKTMLIFIQQHYQENLTIDTIAASASISRSECFRCFKRAINKKPIEFLTEFRIERAANLLLYSEMSIAEICYRCGFSSPSYFGKVFRSIAGSTPRAYRQTKRSSLLPEG